jgi:hypothetical protein
MTKDEALKLALEALDNDSDSDDAFLQRIDAKTAIKQALAQPDKIACTHEWIDDTRTKPAWRCVKCGEEYKKEQK